MILANLTVLNDPRYIPGLYTMKKVIYSILSRIIFRFKNGTITPLIYQLFVEVHVNQAFIDLLES